MLKKTTIIAAFILVFTACQKVVDAGELLDTEETIYITSYISPQDTVLRVNVTRALPAIGTPLRVYDEENENEAKFLINNANVSISDESGNSTSLVYSAENKSYLTSATSLAITEGQRYFLKVVVDGQEFNASCEIPQKIAEIQTQLNYKDDNFGGIEVDINMSFPDITGEKNFYILGGIVNTTYQFEQEEPETYTYPIYFYSDEFQTQPLEDGGVVSGKTYEYIGSGVEVQETTITLQATNVEEIIFQSLRSKSTNADSDGNPFVEYAIAPNNIEEGGAIGVFAGYQLTQKTIDVVVE
jgi:hypothetical protein